MVKGAKDGIEAAGGESSHIEDLAHRWPAAPDDALAANGAAVGWVRCHADEGSDLLAAEVSEFGKVSQEGEAQDAAGAGNALNQVILGSPQWAVTDAVGEITLDIQKFAFEPA